MKNNTMTSAWRQYEAGKDYKRRIGLYETVRRNERYYRGDQWYGSALPDLPRPVFNVIRRIVDYQICTIISGNLYISYTDEDLPYSDNSAVRSAMLEGTDLLTKNAAYRWEREKLDTVMYRLMLDAAISGDGVLYCWWDPSIKTGQPYSGDIVTETVDNSNLFVSDVNSPDLQSQEYIILSGRDSVVSLRREAEKYGADESTLKKIVPDNEFEYGSGDYSKYELEDDDSAKATYLIKFWRENGIVMFEKSTRQAVIRRCSTGMRLYPVAYFNWYPTKDSFHGTSPVSGMISNQKFINRAYALIMKHMTDTAFSKVIYDKSKIPEWSNEVGEAIAAVGGGNIADAVSVVGVGQMQNGYLELIENAMALTKELNGATDTALGNTDPTNTSAIIAMQEAARVPLMQVRASLCNCIEQLAAIWAEMIFIYYPKDRMIPYTENGKTLSASFPFEKLRDALICSHVEVGNIERSSAVAVQSILDKLLDGGHIGAETYVSLLPQGVLKSKDSIIESIKNERERTQQVNGY